VQTEPGKPGKRPPPSPTATATACFSAFARRDPDAFLALVHEDVVWRPSSTLYTSDPAQQRPYQGHAGVRAWFEDVAGWIGYEVRVLCTEDVGDRALISAVATLAGEDVWLTRAVTFVFHVECGRVRDLRTFTDERDARAHLRLPGIPATLSPQATDRGALTIAPEPAQLAKVRARLNDATTNAGLDPGAVNDLLVATTEAVTNAITHGGAENGRVTIEWGREPGLFAVCVHDRGGGHVAQARPAGEREDHGRGIAVMRLLVDELVIESSAAGTAVRIAKRLTPAVEAPPPVGEPSLA